MEAQAKTAEGGDNGNGEGNKMKRKWNTNENDLSNGQRSKRRHPKSDSHFHLCGYILPLKHDSNTSKCKKEGQKDDESIKNIMGGL